MKIRKPKREPDCEFTVEYDGLDYIDIVKIWFKELKLQVVCVDVDTRYENYETTYLLDRSDSLRGSIQWYCSNRSNGSNWSFSLAEETGIEDLDRRTEEQYKRWLAQTAIEKMLKKKR